MITQRFLLGPVFALVAMGALLAGAAPWTSSGRALAQPYPPPVGSLSFTASATITTPGSPVTLRATVLDNQGQPIVDTDVLFRIVQRPSPDTTLEGGATEVTKKTDAQGVTTAQLLPGATPGNVIVEAISIEKTSQLNIALQVTGAPPGLPRTGDNPAEGGEGKVWLFSLLVGLTVAVGGALVLARRRIKS